jgi:mRNA interferase RelE/StbE
MKSIIFTHQAAKEFDALPDDSRGDVSSALYAYAISGSGNVKKLSGREGYRMRMGRYRVIFGEDATTVLAIYIGIRQTTTYGRH